MAPFDLECLPNEILRMLLFGLHSPSDLLALLKASPQCYRMFKLQPAPILAPVVLSFIAPENLQLAVVACNCPITYDWPSVPAGDIALTNVRGHFSTKRMAPIDPGRCYDYRFERLHADREDVAMLSRLCRLCDVVDVFIAVYAEKLCHFCSRL